MHIIAKEFTEITKIHRVRERLFTVTRGNHDRETRIENETMLRC